MTSISTLQQLRHHYPAATGRSLAKELTALDTHCRQLLALCPFYLIGSQGSGADGEPLGDVSPRGDGPGNVHVLDDNTLALPDWPGNNRLDTLTNIIENPAIGMLFLVPGVNETLRINGTAEIRLDEDLLNRFPVNGKLPRSVIVVHVQRAYLQCAKALMRSRLWSPDALIDRASLPTMSEWMNAHGGRDDALVDQDTMEADYRKVMY